MGECDKNAMKPINHIIKLNITYNTIGSDTVRIGRIATPQFFWEIQHEIKTISNPKILFNVFLFGLFDITDLIVYILCL